MSLHTFQAHRSDVRDRGQASVAVLIPCYNEEITVGDVVKQFRAELPEADIYVCDNNSSDRTVEIAREAGARLLFEPRQGKGHVVQTMFRQVDADIYVMVDGDGTYPPANVHELMRPVLDDEADMVIGSRLHAESQSQFHRFNLFGNRLVALLFRVLFSVPLTDILSGYRAFNRKFVKVIPLVSGGFDTEMELTGKAVAQGHRIAEVPVGLRHRPAGSYSKANLFIHGPINLFSMSLLFRDYRPLAFYGLAGLLSIGLGLATDSIVTSKPLKVGLILAGTLLVAVGLILQAGVRRSRKGERRMQYLMDAWNHELKTEKKPTDGSKKGAA